MKIHFHPPARRDDRRVSSWRGMRNLANASFFFSADSVTDMGCSAKETVQRNVLNQFILPDAVRLCNPTKSQREKCIVPMHFGGKKGVAMGNFDRLCRREASLSRLARHRPMARIVRSREDVIFLGSATETSQSQRETGE